MEVVHVQPVRHDLVPAPDDFPDQARIALGDRGVRRHRARDLQLRHDIQDAEDADAVAVIPVRVVPVIGVGHRQRARRPERLAGGIDREPL
jgi:hypothetical protein